MPNGDARDIFRRAIEITTPAFDSLLGVIQSETERIERNRELARQRGLKEDLLDLQAEKEISVYNRTTAVQREKDRDLQRELAGIEELVDAQKEIQQETEELAAAKDETRETLQDRYTKRYEPLKDLGFRSIPTPEFIAKGTSPDNVEGYFRIESNGIKRDLTPKEFEERYGWTAEAAKYVKIFRDLNQNDKLAINSDAKDVGTDTITDATGAAVDIGFLRGEAPEQLEKTLTKKFLGSDEASQIIAKLRAGDKEVFRKFQQGLYDFNTVPSGEQDIRRSLQTNMSNISELLAAEADRFFFPDFLAVFADPEVVGESYSVSEIAREVGEIGTVEDKQRWNLIRQQYGKLKKGRKAPQDKLFVNPKILTGDFTDIPVEDYFLTEKELIEAQPELNISGNDFELTEDNINKLQSRQFLQSAIQDSTN